MPRVTLSFRLSSTPRLHDLVRELGLHHDVLPQADPDGLILTVETSDAPAAVWDVRATIGMFDDAAVEIRDQA